MWRSFNQSKVLSGQDIYTRLFHRTPVTTSEPRLGRSDLAIEFLGQRSRHVGAHIYPPLCMKLSVINMTECLSLAMEDNRSVIYRFHAGKAITLVLT